MAGLGLLAAGLPLPSGQKLAESVPEVLRKSIALYATLTSYADTGTLRQEVPGIVDESTFTTAFRRQTRDLYLDYQPLTSTNPGTKFTIDLRNQRTVLWMVRGEMQKYDFRTKAVEHVSADGGGQVRALQQLTHQTSGVSVFVPSLLYSQAGLPSSVLQIHEATEAGLEDVAGRRCHKVVGTAWAVYPSGARTNVRPVTVWIDADTQLIRKVFEDTPTGYAAGAYLRITTTFDAQANPALEDKRFQFTVPR